MVCLHRHLLPQQARWETDPQQTTFSLHLAPQLSDSEDDKAQALKEVTRATGL